MADTLERTSPLRPWAEHFARLANSVAIVEEPFVTMVDLRVDPSGPGAAAAADLLGVELPAAASTYAKNGDTTVIWLGPDEWLVTGTALAGPELEARLRQLLETRFAELFRQTPEGYVPTWINTGREVLMTWESRH